jgi:hypothetical protein
MPKFQAKNCYDLPSYKELLNQKITICVHQVFLALFLNVKLPPFIKVCLDLEIARLPSGTSLVITLPAAIMALSEILTGATKAEFDPINTFEPILV